MGEIRRNLRVQGRLHVYLLTQRACVCDWYSLYTAGEVKLFARGPRDTNLKLHNCRRNTRWRNEAFSIGYA